LKEKIQLLKSPKLKLPLTDILPINTTIVMILINWTSLTGVVRRKGEEIGKGVRE